MTIFFLLTFNLTSIISANNCVFLILSREWTSLINLTFMFFIFPDCQAAPRSEHPVTAVLAEVATGTLAGVVAEEVELPATGLPAVISYAEVIPSRNIRPCIPRIGSTTWTIFTTSSKPPRTVPTPRYTVIIRIHE